VRLGGSNNSAGEVVELVVDIPLEERELGASYRHRRYQQQCDSNADPQGGGRGRPWRPVPPEEPKKRVYPGHREDEHSRRGHGQPALEAEGRHDGAARNPDGRHPSSLSFVPAHQAAPAAKGGEVRDERNNVPSRVHRHVD